MCQQDIMDYLKKEKKYVSVRELKTQPCGNSKLYHKIRVLVKFGMIRKKKKDNETFIKAI